MPEDTTLAPRGGAILFPFEDFHTYHVGENGVWVHNSNCKLIKNDDGTYDAELSYK